MLSREEIKKWLIENCINEDGELDLNGLDFSDFDGNVVLSGLKVKKNLYQCGQVVGGQVVGGRLYQCFCKANIISQHSQYANKIYQAGQTALVELEQN